MPADPTHAAAYVRISKDRAGEGLGVERQTKELKRLCDLKGLTLVDIYCDNDISASNPRVRRPEYERMLDDIKAGRIGVVLAWDDDRLVRRPTELERFFEVIDAAGATYSTMSNNVNVATGDGVLVARIRGAVAAEEVRKLSVRSRSKHAELAERGRPSGGGFRAYGYSCLSQQAIQAGTTTCELPGCTHDGIGIIEPEAANIRAAATKYIEGEGFRPIARWLNQIGALTGAGNQWTDASLRNVLVNPRYAGHRVHKGETIGPALWKPILEESEHRTILALCGQRHRPGPRGPRIHYLSGLVVCARCGNRLDIAPVGARYTYRCSKRPGTSACGGLAISALPVDVAVANMLITRMSTPAIDSAAAGRKQKKASTESDILAHLNELRQRSDVAADMFANGEIDRAQLRNINDRLRGPIEEARAALVEASGNSRVAEISRNGPRLAADWPTLSVGHKNTVARSLIQTIRIHPGIKGSHTVNIRERVEVIWS